VNASEANRSSAGNDSTAAGDTTASNDPLTLLGQTLRQAREQQGLSTGALASQLHMGEEQLHALESGDPERLPELVFVIAQARRVAAALGIDATPLVAPIKQLSSQIKPAPAPLSAAEPAGRQRPRARLSAQSYTQQPRPRANHSAAVLRWLGSLALLAGVGAAGMWGWQRAPQMIGRLKPQPQPPSQVKPAKAVAKPVLVAPKPAPPSPATELTLSAAQPSWLSVRTAKGKVLFEGTFKGTRQFSLEAGLELLAGRPDLVVVSQGGAKGKPLGRIDQIRWVSFSAPPR
jgi:cytoskeletal protein RodZ